MATTTNYVWETPDDTDLVKDGAAAIRTLGSSIDTTTKALNPSTTLGDIEYRSSTANTNTRLGIGTTGQVLTVSGGVPSWATPAGGGKVLQVVNATYSTQTTSSSSTFVTSGLTATITPTSATSKILVLTNNNGCGKESSNTFIQMKLTRNSTDLITFENGAASSGGTGTNYIGSISCCYLDSPATTSATTYLTKIASGNNTSYINTTNNGTTSTITLLEIGA